MYWYIKDILIYGREDEIRHLTFEPGVNIITGDSQTGKSALIAIVDYCLGASDYEVPVGVIREFAMWYAVRLQTDTEQIFVARREPGARRISDSMHLVIRQEVAIPRSTEITGNSNRDAVVAELSKRIGMMEQSLAESIFDTALTEPPTIRNVVPFLFQPQGVIANKDQLFYKTDEEKHREHRQRLQKIFPYVLGAINAEYFQLKGSLDVAKRELRQQERLLNERQSLASDGLSIASSLWDRAVALGLAGAGGDETQSSDLASLRARLLSVVERADYAPSRQPAVAGDPARATELESRSRTIRTEIAALRRQANDARELSHEASGYTGALRLQRGRLRAINILPAASHDASVCPVCSQSIDGIVPSIEQIRALNQEVETELDSMTAVGPALAQRVAQLDSTISQRRLELAQVESELSGLYRVHADAASADAAWAEQQRLIGAIRLYVDRVPVGPQDTSDLARRVEEIRRRVALFERELDGFDTADRLESALVLIAQFMTELSKDLNLERRDASVRLDIKRLTVIRTSPSGRPERLNEIGSGENWVGYHLCALFALHRFFVDAARPVPSFLFLDQPSQIYFPQEREASPGTPAASQSVETARTDWDAVRDLYRLIFRAVATLEGRLQVIVVDHADLRDPPEFRTALRYSWHEGKKLI